MINHSEAVKDLFAKRLCNTIRKEFQICPKDGFILSEIFADHF